MSRRHDYTLILVTERVVLRFDTRTQSMQRIECHSDMLSDAVKAALESPPARQVAVLSTGVWNQLISISRAAVDGLEADQLAEALKYEVEPLVGIDAGSASLGFVEVDGNKDFRRFWVNVLEREQWQAVRELLKSKKNRDITVAHPLVVSNLGGGAGIEFWDKAAFQLSEAGRLENSDVVSAGSERWVGEFGFDSLSDAIENVNFIVGPESELPSPELNDAKSLLDLNDEATALRWFKHAARKLDDAVTSAPVIRPEQKAKNPVGQWVIPAAALLLVVAFGGWHLSWLNQKTKTIDSQIAKLGEPAIVKQKFDAQLRDVLQKRELAIDDSMNVKVDLQRVRFFFENQNDRTWTLLSKLLELRTNELVIREITVTEQGTVVSGVSLDSDAAPLLTNRLRDAVSSVGWKIHPASQEGLLKMTSGGPWKFSILLEDVGPPDLMPRESRSGVAAKPAFKKRVRP